MISGTNCILVVLRVFTEIFAIVPVKGLAQVTRIEVTFILDTEYSLKDQVPISDRVNASTSIFQFLVLLNSRDSIRREH